MDMSGERRIPAPREKVWAALNDPAVLKASIPGCDTLEKLSDTELKATASVKIGPIAAKFAGKVQLLDLDPPNGYRIEGEGQGGVAGFAKGGASVRLAQDGTDTIRARIERGHINLLETLCDDVAATLLAHPLVRAVRVSSSKLDVYADCDGAGVEVFHIKDPTMEQAA